jgi:AcrR family transcriptional regulator
MSQAPIQRRPYRSPLRAQQARETRQAVLDAAQSLFESEGYLPTTMEAVARAAEVSLKTVYSHFSTKSALLRGVWDRGLKGSDTETPLQDQDWYRELIAEVDPRKQIQLTVERACAMREHVAAMLRAIRSAASVDADGAELWTAIQREYYDLQAEVVRAIADHGGLRPGVDVETAVDVLWTLNHPDVWMLFVGERGWTPGKFKAWLLEAAVQQLLGPTR